MQLSLTKEYYIARTLVTFAPHGKASDRTNIRLAVGYVNMSADNIYHPLTTCEKSPEGLQMDVQVNLTCSPEARGTRVILDKYYIPNGT